MLLMQRSKSIRHPCNEVNRPSVLEKLHELVQAAAELTGKVRHKGPGARPMNTKKLTKWLALYLPYILLGLVATNWVKHGGWPRAKDWAIKLWQ